MERRTPLRKYSVGILIKNRLDRAVPVAVEFLEQFLRRRDAARDRFLERTQIARLVAAVAVEIFAARQPARGKAQRLLRQREHIAAADLGGKAEPGHVVAQLLPFLGAPAFDHVPAGTERVIIVQQPDPIGGRSPPIRSGSCTMTTRSLPA